ncbi:FAD dependent oxidoreductase [Isoptericola sp. CG 20/1183]|uniref:FAD dependent oxidoreductase n=1 Tax=Isoptericola halotolerans TaxID=300560 RepID=A0ABX5EKL4_9MICO|nr:MULTISPECIES: FAD-dependent oxidoreductase [Isoptericola]PRZ08861.1 FAD dependent oxidoreductase [Isoptericola halotolerans]PRZ10692.1 FAD dependent oxidoreductase [Isoptericola sp. CG 20/1183]
MTGLRLAVIGGGLGGVAAALAAADAGATVTLTAAEPMVGGQITAQATSPLDEHPLVETTGAPGSYHEMRRRLRAAYGGLANPGDGWVSRLCFEPDVGRQVLEDMLAEHVASGRLRVLLDREPVAARTTTDAAGRAVVEAVELAGPGGVREVVTADTFVDATELGDLLPLVGADWVIGSEGSEAFGEPHALPGGPDPLAEQSCTWVAGLTLREDPGPVGGPPRGYARHVTGQPFGLDIPGWDGTLHRYAMFGEGPTGNPPFWTYRRVRSGALLGGQDAVVLNWAGNDYAATGLVADRERTLRGARDLTLGFVHWLRTEAPRDDGGRGYPELALDPGVTGTADGLAHAPYVRESRRLASGRPVTELDLAVRGSSERAVAMPDSLGTAWYHADLHPRVGHPQSVYAPTSPFQVPARALVPEAGRGPVNLVAGAKNLAATQVAAAAYRVHPGEWSVGEAAGVLAVQADADGRTPTETATSTAGVRRAQERLLARGTPLVWTRDVPADHPAFAAVNRCVLRGGLVGERARTLDLRPDEGLDEAERASIAHALGLGRLPEGSTWGDAVLSAQPAHPEQARHHQPDLQEPA